MIKFGGKEYEDLGEFLMLIQLAKRQTDDEEITASKFIELEKQNEFEKRNIIFDMELIKEK